MSMLQDSLSVQAFLPHPVSFRVLKLESGLNASLNSDLSLVVQEVRKMETCCGLPEQLK